MKPKTAFVNTPAAVAQGYVAYRRQPRFAISQSSRMEGTLGSEVDGDLPAGPQLGARARARDRSRGDGRGTVDRTRRQERRRSGSRRRDAVDAGHGDDGRTGRDRRGGEG